MTQLPTGQSIGIGNSPMTTPYQKVTNGTEIFDQIVNGADKDNLPGKLMAMLKSKERFYPDAELDHRVGKYASELSSIDCSIPSSNYGTRTHTVILVSQSNKMSYYEETMATMDPNDEWTKTFLEKQF
jgi:uncharacterized protein with NRDE domain